MTVLEFLDRNLKTILFFIALFGMTGWFGAREAYLSSAQVYGMWNAFMIAPTETALRLIQ